MSLPLPTGLPTPTGRDVLLTFATGLVLPVLAALGWAAGMWVTDAPSSWFAGALVSAVATMALGLWWALVRRNGWGLVALGFTRPRVSLWHLAWELPLVLTAALGFAGIYLTLTKTPGAGTQNQESVAAFGLNPGLLLLGGLIIVVIVPLLEEIMFRRVLLDWLRAKLHAALAIPLSAAIFAAMHVAPAAMAYLFPLAIGMAWLRIRHDSLWASAALHMLNNALAFTAAMTALSA